MVALTTGYGSQVLTKQNDRFSRAFQQLLEIQYVILHGFQENKILAILGASEQRLFTLCRLARNHSFSGDLHRP